VTQNVRVTYRRVVPALETKLSLMFSCTNSECLRHGEHFGSCYAVLRGLRRTQEAIVPRLPLKSGMQFAVHFFSFLFSAHLSEFWTDLKGLNQQKTTKMPASTYGQQYFFFCQSINLRPAILHCFGQSINLRREILYF
jgi:hypothetical protein